MRIVKMGRTLLSMAALAAGCAVIDEQAADTHHGGAQGQPHPSGGLAPAHAGPAGHGVDLVRSAEGARSNLLPLGNPVAAINVSSGLRTDPRGQHEGYLGTAEVGLPSGAPPPLQTAKVALDLAAPAMAGAEGPGGPTGGSALPREAPSTAVRK